MFGGWYVIAWRDGLMSQLVFGPVKTKAEADKLLSQARAIASKHYVVKPADEFDVGFCFAGTLRLGLCNPHVWGLSVNRDTINPMALDNPALYVVKEPKPVQRW